MATRTINVPVLARVEGEGALTLTIEGDVVSDVELRILEPPRLFEALLQGRGASEAPDITARICGICPVAYQMSACHAVEDAAGLRVTEGIRVLRRLLYCGEWIQSHVLHIVMLHAPDFLRVDDVLGLAKLHPERVKAALAVKKAGNAIIEVLGGREVHPINVRVGGFYSAPTRSEMDALKTKLEAVAPLAEQLCDWVASFSFPAFERDVEMVALGHPTEYPFNEGRLVSTAGLDIEPAEFESNIVEDQVPRSTALHARIVGRGPYVCGPLARFAINAQRLRARAGELAERVGLRPDCRNPFRSIVARAIEVVQALDEAIVIAGAYRPEAPAFIECPVRAGRGHSITEAPRGILYHRYDIDDAGGIVNAKIVPPTSQNQRSIELDLFALGPELVRRAEDEARRLAEHAIRNYDPCISCSTHFLQMKIVRRDSVQ